MKVKELAKLSKSEARSKIMKKKKVEKKTSSNLPNALQGWLKTESGDDSGADTDILDSDEESEREIQERKDNFYKNVFLVEDDSESLQSEASTSTEVQPQPEESLQSEASTFTKVQSQPEESLQSEGSTFTKVQPQPGEVVESGKSSKINFL